MPPIYFTRAPKRMSCDLVVASVDLSLLGLKITDYVSSTFLYHDVFSPAVIA